MIKKFNEYNSNFNMLLGYTKDELVELISGEFTDKEDAFDEVDYYVDLLEDLYNNGGIVYRLVFLNKKSDLNSDFLGKHWILDPATLDRFYNGLQSGETIGKIPYLITANINKNQIDVKSSIESFIQLPLENEINLNYDPKSYIINLFK